MVLTEHIQRAGKREFPERRRGLRVRQTRPIKVYEPTIARYFGGETRDVSATGLKIELPAGVPVREGRFLSVHVGVGDSGQPLANRRNMIPARIVWIDRKDSRPGRLTCGVEFIASITAELDAA